MKTRTYLLAVVLLACIGVVLAISLRHREVQRRTATAAVEATVNAHSGAIATLLTTMASSPPGEIQDAIYHELQTEPTTSLLSRDDIRIEQAPGTRNLRCILSVPAAGRTRVIVIAASAGD